MPLFDKIRSALRQLQPGMVREQVSRPVHVGLAPASSETLATMEDFLAPPELSHRRRLQLFDMLHRIGDAGNPRQFDIVITAGLPDAPNAFPFYAAEPERTVREVLREREDLSLALARWFPPFRKPVIEAIIGEVSRQNALFALFTALPAAIPNLLALGWAAGEFASDTAVLTVNQVRMAFLIAAASDHAVGFSEQSAQIGAIVGGAFGWRAVARELAGRFPFGEGLIPKAAIAYAGTYVVGLGLERFYALGYTLTRGERDAAYRQALEAGKRFARWALESRREPQS